MYRILHIEDEVDQRQRVADLIAGLGDTCELLAVESLESAERALADDFDLVICDIVIPPVDKSFAKSEEHGFAVYDLVHQNKVGTPAVFLTGHASEVDAFSRLEDAPKVDLYGLRRDEPMLRLLQKDRPEDLAAYVNRWHAELETLRAIVVRVEGGEELAEHESRCFRIYARRQGAARIELVPSKGLSSAKSHLMFALDEHDRPVARTFVKSGRHVDLEDEQERHRRYVAGMLDSGDYPALADRVVANARSTAALFFSLAERFDSNLFGAFEAGAATFRDSVAEVRRMMGPWAGTRRSINVSLRDLRRERVSDEVVALKAEMDADLFESVEGLSFDVAETVQHGDLHGLNALRAGDGRLQLIDFGDVGPCVGADDPVNLELSFVFHSRRPEGEWLDRDAARSWIDGVPDAVDDLHAEVLVLCREWARDSGMSEADYLIPTYVHALRQLKYDDTDHDLAVAIAASAARRLLEIR